MKEKSKKLFLIIIAVIIIVGAVFYSFKKFNMEDNYSAREQILISNQTGIDEKKIEEIVKSVLNKKVTVNKVERFGTTVQISTYAISEEEKEAIVNKVNEELGLSISNDDVKITKIANTRVRDVLKQYIIPVVAIFSSVLLYFVIVYHKLGLKKVLVKGVAVPVVTELTYYAIIAITRIPFGKAVNSIAIGLAALSITWVAICFQKEKNDKKEND